MQQVRNNEENFNNKNSLSNIPGMATLKAISIFSFPFLRSEVLREEKYVASGHTLEMQEDIAALKERISFAEQETEDTSGTYTEDKLQEETPMITKAQSMVQHLKHTKNS